MSAEWKTAAEWAGEKLAGLPGTTRGVDKLSRREDWQILGPTKARKRKGRGGGWEYHLSCLPEVAQRDFTARVERAAKEAAARELVARNQAAVAERKSNLPAGVSARQRQVMEARAAVVIEVRRREMLCGSANKAVAALLTEAKAGTLSSEIMAHLQCAADKKRGDVPGRTQIYEWRKAMADGGAAALIPMVRPQETKSPPPAWVGLLLRYRQMPSKVSLMDAWTAFCKDADCPKPAPSYAQARAALASLKGTARHLELFKGREGPLALKARLAFVRRDIEGLEPGDVYTADGKTFGAAVSHPIHGNPFRPEITTVLDVATKKVVGWSVGLKENTITVADALRHACETHGIPAIFYTDRGPGYRNKVLDHDVTGMAARLGITPDHSLPYNSQARGLIERVQGTIWNRLARRFASYQERDMDREARKLADKTIKADIKEKGASPLMPGWEAFVAAVAEAVEAYNASPQRSLRRKDPETGKWIERSPNEAWEEFEAKGFEKAELAPGEADDLFRLYEERVVDRCELRWINNLYFSLDLTPYDGERVLVGIDIHDASRLWVRKIEEIDGKQAPGALITIAKFAGNKTGYYPVSFVERTKENRRKTRLRLNEEKAREIDAEAGAPLLVPHTPAPVARFAPPGQSPAPVPASVAPVLSAPRRLSPLDDNEDVQLARELLDDPSALTPGRARLMREALTRPSSRELFRLAGVDVMALHALITSAA